MKVLFLSHSYPRFPTDPVGSFVLRLAVALRGQDVDTRVIAPAAPGLARREEYEGVVVERFRYAPARFETLAYTGTMRDQVRGSWTAKAALGSLMASEFAKALRVRSDFRADLVHAHWWFPGGMVGTWLRRWWRVPLVITMHGSDVRLARGSRLAAGLFRRVLTRADAVTTVSSWLATETAAIAPAVRPIVAPMPIKPDLFYPGGPRAPDRLLFVGKLNPQKGIEHLLRALALMRARPHVDVVVGMGSAPADVAELAQSLGVADRLRWFPLLRQSELADRYRACTALVMPAVDEGLGLVAAEALLCETPVVAFASGGLTDLIVDGRTGLLVPPGDVAALARALDDLLARPDRGAGLGAAGRQAMVASFGPDSVAARYAGIYRDVLAERPGRNVA
jgi:glycosyltransferase involved in cell wall biosynthesis